MDVDAGDGGKPVADLASFVGGVVVYHQVQFLVGVGAGEVFDEAQELLVAVTVLAQAGDLAGRDFKGGEKRRGAVADVVMGAPFGSAGLHWQHRLGAAEGLDLGLLVDAQHDGVLGRVEAEPNHVGQLGDQFGVGGELEDLGAYGLDSSLPQRFSDC